MRREGGREGREVVREGQRGAHNRIKIPYLVCVS